MLRIFKKLDELDFSQLMELYREGNEENGRFFWPDLSFDEQRSRACEAFYKYLRDDFFQQREATYVIWQEDGRYISALRLEAYKDGLLMEALETHPDERQKGYATLLISNVQNYLGEMRIYSHVSKHNSASLRTHERCGFHIVLDYEENQDGAMNNNAVTMRWEGKAVILAEYGGEQEAACILIRRFWKEHNAYSKTIEEAEMDLKAWTASGHRFFFIINNDEKIGFIHLGSRGAAVDWLEELFVLPEYQGHGFGSKAIALVEELVKDYSDCLYIEAAARNLNAIRLYHKVGYDCLNTVTLRKDFYPETHETYHKEILFDLSFEIRRRKE